MHKQPRDWDRPRGQQGAPSPEEYGHRAPGNHLEQYGYPEPPGYGNQPGYPQQAGYPEQEYPAQQGYPGQPGYAGEYGLPGPDEYLAHWRHRTHDASLDYPQPDRYREPGPPPGYPEQPAPRRPGGDLPPPPPPARPARPIPPEAYQALLQQAVRKPRWPYALLVVSVAFVGLVAGMLIGSKVWTSTPPAATSPAAVSSAAASPTATPSATASAGTASGGTGVLAHFSGSGAETTRRFTVPGSGNWELKWAYNCASLGSTGNLIVTEDRADATGVTVNELGLQGHGVTHGYGDAGRHYLVVNSECAWSMTAVAQR